jgi:capsular polysaccharide export protein
MNERIKKKLLKLKNNPKQFFLDMKSLPDGVKKFIKHIGQRKVASGPYAPGLLKNLSLLNAFGSGFQRKCALSYLYAWTHPTADRVKRIVHLLHNYPSPSEQLIRQAQECLDALRLLEEDFFISSSGADEQFVLVIGQEKENVDLTCLAPKNVAVNNYSMIMTAISENPRATVIYKTFTNDSLKLSLSNIPETKACVKVVEDDLYPPEKIMRVYTWDSILGFEYLMFSVPVTIFGTPFYAGWGLTNDFGHLKKPTINVSKEELFISTFWLLSDMVCPVTKLPMSFKQGLTTVWMMKEPFFLEILTPNDSEQTIEALLGAYSNRVLRYSSERSPFESVILKDPGSLRQNLFGKILYNYVDKRDNRLEDLQEAVGGLSVSTMLVVFCFVFHYLCKYGRFDALQESLEFYGEYFERYQHLMNNDEILTYMDIYAAYFKMLYGRTVSHVPFFYLDDKPLNDSRKKVLRSHVTMLIQNFEYDRAESLVNDSRTVDVTLLSAVARQCNLMVQAEADSYKRQKLGAKMALKVLSSLSNIYPEHELLNRLFYWLLVEDIESVIANCQAIVADALEKNFQGKRLAVLNELVGFLITNRQLKLAQEINQMISCCKPQYLKNSIRILADRSELEEIDELLSQYSSLNLQDDPQVKLWYVQALRQREQFEEARTLLRTLPASTFKNYSLTQKYHVATFTADILDVIIEFDKYFGRVNQPVHPKGVVVFASSSTPLGMLCLALDAPILLELKKQGYAVISLSKGIITGQKTRKAPIDYCHGLVPMASDDGQVKLKWNIDISNKLIEAEGINFYQGFYERLSVESRRYHVDFEQPNLKKLFRQILLKSDCFVRAMMRIKTDLTDKGIPVYFVLSIDNLAPYSIVRDFCAKHGGPTLQLVYIRNGYDYYKDEESLFSNTITVANVTNHPRCRIPHLGVREKFAAWYEGHKKDPEVIAGIEQEIERNINKSVPENPLELMLYLKDEKLKGKRIICAFSRLLVDLVLPFDGGPAGHLDIVDWLHHTIEIAGKSRDTILLLKPHPCEVLPKIARRLQEFLTDVLPKTLPPNVIVLGHHHPTTQELAEVLDLGVLWSGTAGYELTILGTPVMLCSYWGEYDYLFEVLAPKNREQYEEFLLVGRFPAVSEEESQRAAAAMYYRRSNNVSLPLDYFSISSTNDFIGFQMPNNERFEAYLKNDDPMLEKAVRQFFE